MSTWPIHGSLKINAAAFANFSEAPGFTGPKAGLLTGPKQKAVRGFPAPLCTLGKGWRLVEP